MVTDKTMIVLGFEGSRNQTEKLAAQLQVPFDLIKVHRFPDGESCVTVPIGLPETVVFMQSLDQPNQKLIELLLAESAARKHGCKQSVLVAPYLCYMRQDIEFEPGQAISQLIIGDLLSKCFDTVITIDPHLHRIKTLDEAFTHCEAISLSAAGLIGTHLSNNAENAILVGPDEESEQWVKVAAKHSGMPWCVASKVRSGDRNVKVALPKVDFQGKHAILLDDVISSGHTMKEAAEALLEAGCTRVDAACTHALFAAGAEQALKASGVNSVISCNSIPHQSNRIDLSPLFAETLRARLY